MSGNAQFSARFILFATGVTAIGGFLFGYDTAVINGANNYLKEFMHLSPIQEGIAGASAILGCIPGALCGGFLSDRFGRKRVLLLCALLYAISGVASAIPSLFWQFLVARLISGLGIGASSSICPVYIAEIAPERWRGRLGTLFQLGIVLGIFITLLVNKLIQGLGNEAWNTSFGWRWMLGLEALPAIVFMLLLFAVPESPRWLAQNQLEDKATAIWTRVGGAEFAAHEIREIRLAATQDEGTFSELFSGAYLRPLLLAIGIMAFSQLSGVNAIMYYSTKIFVHAGGTTNAAFSFSVWIGLINLFFTFVAISLVDKLGRRPLLIAGTFIQTLALIVVSWMFHIHQHGLSLLVPIIFFTASFDLAMGPIGWLFSAEIFPGKIRGRAMSVASLTVWVSCYIVTETFPLLNDSPAIGPARTFAVYAAISFLSLLFITALVPETKNRTLEQIEQSWLRRTG